MISVDSYKGYPPPYPVIHLMTPPRGRRADASTSGRIGTLHHGLKRQMFNLLNYQIWLGDIWWMEDKHLKLSLIYQSLPKTLPPPPPKLRVFKSSHARGRWQYLYSRNYFPSAPSVGGLMGPVNLSHMLFNFLMVTPNSVCADPPSR